jgi:non-homologous end joining protein Ku
MLSSAEPPPGSSHKNCVDVSLVENFKLGLYLLESPLDHSNPTLMAARSIGTATISFGLVSVPVNLYSSAESKSSVSFNMLHKKCGSRLKQQYTCPKDNEVVGREDTSKGYEFAKDQYVVFTPEELKALEEKATSKIDVVEFVPLAQVDREFRDKVRERVMEAIQRKVDGQDITADVTPDGGGKIIDLMEALKASLAKTAPADEDERKVKAS